MSHANTDSNPASIHLHSLTANHIPFSKDDYSEFKFGNKSIATRMGQELGIYLSDYLNKNNSAERREIIFYSSPYDYIPTSSLYLTESCFNVVQSVTGFGCIMGKINRLNTYADNYGLMDAEERFALISRDTYDFSELPDPEKLLIFVDDISITGTHQRVIENLLAEHRIPNPRVFVYYAMLIDNSPPQIEEHLNSSKIMNHHSLASLILSGHFAPTTRAIKFILSLNLRDLEQFYITIKSTDANFFTQMLKLARANKYHTMTEFRYSFNFIEELHGQIMNNTRCYQSSDSRGK